MSTLLTTADFVAAVAACPFAPAGVTYAAIPSTPNPGAPNLDSPDAFRIVRTQGGVSTTRWTKVYWHGGIGYGPSDANPNGSSVEIRAFDSTKAVSDAAAFIKTLV